MKLKINQKELFNKLFVLGFVWLTPMSIVGILRSSIVWSLVNGVNINIPWLSTQQQQDLTATLEDILSEESIVNGESSVKEESTGSSPEEVNEVNRGEEGMGIQH